MRILKRINLVSVCIFNLLLVSLFGLLMRYKIAFEFPFFEQRNLQHAHSHFAFAGWVSLLLMVLIVKSIETKKDFVRTIYFDVLLIANLFCSYGILISFIIQGYGFWSILFLVFSIVLSFAFTIEYLKKIRSIGFFESNKWFLAGLFFNVISTFGTFALSYMMATRTVDQDNYLMSIYWYLHFQYNGWFFFICIGLLIDYLDARQINVGAFKQVFWLFFISNIPAVGLSMLWANVSVWIYVVIVISAIVQLATWFKFIYELYKLDFLKLFPCRSIVYFLFICLFIAFTSKFVLQTASTIPSISHLAFGFRPIVIAYLHLVLLACISMFLIVFVMISQYVIITKQFNIGLIVFVIGIYLNEIVLGIQGVLSLSYTIIPNVNELLFSITIIIVIGLIILTTSLLKSSKG